MTMMTESANSSENNTFFDGTMAQRVIDFCQQLKLPDGQFAGQKMRLMPWQIDWINKFFGTINTETGLRQYKWTWAETCKKSGKSTLFAAIGIYLLVADGEQGAKIFVAAATKEQAGTIFDTAAYMVSSNKYLSKICKVIESRKIIKYQKTNSIFQALSSDAKSKAGLLPSAVLIDELAQHFNDDLFQMLTYGSQITRKQPVVISITNAGNSNHFSYQYAEKARKIRDGLIKQDDFLPIIYAADVNDNPEAEETWIKANPSVNYNFTLADIRKEFETAKQTPREFELFKQYRCGMWVNQHKAWLDLNQFDLCKDNFTINDLYGKKCYCGLDLSGAQDLSCLAIIVPDDGKLKLYVKSYLPENNIDKKSITDSADYRLWEKLGYLNLIPGDLIDYSDIANDIKSIFTNFDNPILYYDRWQATQLIFSLQNAGLEDIFPCGQGFRDMSNPSKLFFDYLTTKKIVHDGNPVLRYCCGNATVEQDPAGNIKPVKNKSRKRIDAVVATIMALAAYDKFAGQIKPESAYVNHGIRTL